jgi:hypothetical protein
MNCYSCLQPLFVYSNYSNCKAMTCKCGKYNVCFFLNEKLFSYNIEVNLNGIQYQFFSSPRSGTVLIRKNIPTDDAIDMKLDYFYPINDETNIPLLAAKLLKLKVFS